MFKTITYHAEASKVHITLFVDKSVSGYSFCCMEIYRNGKDEIITDSSGYLLEIVPELLKDFILEDKMDVFGELGIKEDELTLRGAIELKQIIKKVKRKLCKSKVK